MHPNPRQSLGSSGFSDGFSRLHQAFAGVVLIGAFLLCLLAAARNSSAASTEQAAQPAIVTVVAGKPSEYEFKLSPLKVKHGTVVFQVTNVGKHAHSFSINGQATKAVRPHRSASLTVVFKHPGRYIYQCNEDVADVDTFGPCGSGILKVT